MQAFVDAVEKCNHDRNFLSITLPYLDGILLDDLKNIKYLLRIFENQG